MNEPKKVDVRERCIFDLLRYCEELLTYKIATERILRRNDVRGWRASRDREIAEIGEKLDMPFHVLHAYLREKDWKGLRRTLAEEINKLTENGN